MAKNGFHIRIQQEESYLNIENLFLGFFFLAGQCYQCTHNCFEEIVQDINVLKAARGVHSDRYLVIGTVV